MTTLLAGSHAEIGLDLHYVSDEVSSEAVQREAQFLAAVAKKAGRREHAAMQIGLSLDIAACVESDGSVSTLFFIPVRTEQGFEPVLAALEAQVPILAAELTYAWSSGFTHVLITANVDAEQSLHAARQRGEVSNHQLVEMRPAALRQLHKILK